MLVAAKYVTVSLRLYQRIEYLILQRILFVAILRDGLIVAWLRSVRFSLIFYHYLALLGQLSVCFNPIDMNCAPDAEVLHLNSNLALFRSKLVSQFHAGFQKCPTLCNFCHLQFRLSCKFTDVCRFRLIWDVFLVKVLNRTRKMQGFSIFFLKLVQIQYVKHTVNVVSWC